MKNVIQKSLMILMVIMACGQVDAYAATKALPRTFAKAATQTAKRAVVATKSMHPAKLVGSVAGTAILAGLVRQGYLMYQVRSAKAAVTAAEKAQADSKLTQEEITKKEAAAKAANSLSAQIEFGKEKVKFDELKNQIDAAKKAVTDAEKARDESWFKQACDKLKITSAWNSVKNWWDTPAAAANAGDKKEAKADEKK